MRQSTPEYASAELAPIAAPSLPRFYRSSTLGAIARRTGGRIGLALTGVTLAMALLAPVLATSDPFALSGPALTPPSFVHPMGTDALGRDLFSGVLYGARASLLAAFSVVVLAFVCGTSIGMIAGYRGGIFDDVLMRFTELFQVVPRFFLIIIIIAVFGPGLDRLVLLLGFTSWPVLARVLRGEVLAMRQLEFVRAAEASGASTTRVLWRELLPNVMPSTLVLLGLLFGQVLIVEGSLGFLGLGDPSALTWGALAGQSQGYLRVAWWLSLFPGLAITFAVLGTNLLADAIALSARNYDSGPDR